MSLPDCKAELYTCYMSPHKNVSFKFTYLVPFRWPVKKPTQVHTNNLLSLIKDILILIHLMQYVAFRALHCQLLTALTQILVSNKQV